MSRHHDPHDERSVIIALLAAGLALQTQASRIPEQIQTKLCMQTAELAALRIQLTELLAWLS